MNKEETNSIIKDAMVRNLQKCTSIPEDISETYKAWVIGLTSRASTQLTQTQGAQQQQAQGQAPEGATAPEQQGAGGQEGQGQEQEEASA